MGGRGRERGEGNGRIGYFNRKGEVVIPAGFDFGLPFEHGQALVCQGCVREYDGEHYHMAGGKWGCVEKRGRLVTPLTDAAPRCGR